MSDAFSRLVRRLLSREVPGEALFRVPLPLAQGLQGAGLWACTPGGAASLHSSRWRKKGPPILWAMLQNEQEWCAQAREDLHWMVHGHADQWPSTEGAAWPLWWHIFRKQPQRVKRQAQKRQAIEFKAYKEQAAVDVCKWYMYRQIKVEALHEEPATTWLCRVCDRVFKTKAALSVHFFKTHGRCAGYRHYLQGTKCEGCNKEFWTRGRLEDHLRASAKCVGILRRTRRPQDSAPQAEHFTHRRRPPGDVAH